jgi:hypothetical protein
LVEALRQNHSLLCALSVSESARRCFLRGGWLDLGQVPRYARLLRPLSEGDNPLGSWSASRSVARLSRAAAPLIRGFDAAILPLARAGTVLETVPRFDERVDLIWQKTKSEYSVLARRDLAMLRWRFDDSPQAAAYQRYLLMRSGRPIGYAVTRRKGPSLVVVDYLCAPAAVRPLFAHCIHLARQEDAVLIACLGMPRRIATGLGWLGFMRRPGPRLMIRPDSTVDIPVLTHPHGWFITEGDSDLDHVLEGS